VGVLVDGYTTGGYEWISNVNVGKRGRHEGFSKAADEIYAKVNSYIKSKKINTSNIKLWVTGHSRGGAVTGMVAVKLNEKYGAKNVFAYGFATPNGVPTDIAKKTYSGNIFNIVNPGDFVPYVVPTSWDFTKFGTTYEISVSSTGKSYYKTMSQDSYGGMSVSERKELISAFCKLSPNRAAYYKTAKNGSSPSDFGRAIGLFKSSVGLSNETLDLLTGCIGKQGSGSTLWNLVTGSQKIAEAHFMETYLAMVYDKYE